MKFIFICNAWLFENQSTIFDKIDTIESIISRQLFHFGRFDYHYNDRSNG
jgi:hypothetical protein